MASDISDRYIGVRVLELAILGLLKEQELHGYELKKRLAETLGPFSSVSFGSLYPALQRLEERGLIDADWGTSENNRRARFYTLTRKGRKELVHEESEWRRIAAAIMRILGKAHGRA